MLRRRSPRLDEDSQTRAEIQDVFHVDFVTQRKSESHVLRILLLVMQFEAISFEDAGHRFQTLLIVEADANSGEVIPNPEGVYEAGPGFNELEFFRGQFLDFEPIQILVIQRDNKLAVAK